MTFLTWHSYLGSANALPDTAFPYYHSLIIWNKNLCYEILSWQQENRGSCWECNCRSENINNTNPYPLEL